MEQYDDIIIGAGLSGLSCAVHLVDQGRRVLVLEGRGVIGGRTSSWNAGDMEVESGMHRYLGFYQALPELLDHVGQDIDSIVHWEDAIEIRLPDGPEPVTFGLSPLHNPWQSLTGVLGNNNFISPKDKAKLGVFFTAGMAAFAKDPDSLDRYSVASYARHHGLEQSAIARVLVPLTEGLFFLNVEKYSATNFFGLFAPYLGRLQTTRVGSFNGGMTEVLMKPLADYVATAGGTVECGKPVEELLCDDQRPTGVRCGQETIVATNVIVATALAQAQSLLRPLFRGQTWFHAMDQMPSMPSVTLQVETTEPVLDHDRTTFSPGTMLASYAEQSRTTFKGSGRLSAILASPETYLEMPVEKVMARLFQEAPRLNLNLGPGTVKHYHMVRWADDFYSYIQGTYRLRPPARTPVPGLILAGDYTDQPYLSTMEGAVVSGRIAADIAIR